MAQTETPETTTSASAARRLRALTSSVSNSPGSVLRSILRSNNLYILVVEFALIAFFSIFSPYGGFFDIHNFVNIAWDTSETLLLAIGETFVIITAGIDLSVGTVLMLAGVTTSWTLAQLAGTPAQIAAGQYPHAGFAILVAIPVGLLVGIIFGAINGVLVARLKLPP